MRVQLQGPLCGRGHEQWGLSAQARVPARVWEGTAGVAPGPLCLEPREGKGGRRKSAEIGAQGSSKKVLDK